MDEEQSCNHAIGTATVEYHESVIHTDDDDLMSYNHFGSWNFCPYCGESVDEAARAIYAQIEKNEEEWQKKYGKRLVA